MTGKPKPTEVPEEVKALGEMMKAWDYLAPFIVPRIREACRIDEITKKQDEIIKLLNATLEGFENAEG